MAPNDQWKDLIEKRASGKIVSFSPAYVPNQRIADLALADKPDALEEIARIFFRMDDPKEIIVNLRNLKLGSPNPLYPYWPNRNPTIMHWAVKTPNGGKFLNDIYKRIGHEEFISLMKMRPSETKPPLPGSWGSYDGTKQIVQNTLRVLKEFNDDVKIELLKIRTNNDYRVPYTLFDEMDHDLSPYGFSPEEVKEVKDFLDYYRSRVKSY